MHVAKISGAVKEAVVEGAKNIANTMVNGSSLEQGELVGEAGVIVADVALGSKGLGNAAKVVKVVDKVEDAARAISVIGPRSTYREFAKEIGANFLDVTDEAWTMRKNVEFLQSVVKRGDDVVFAGNYNPKRLDPKSVLAQEIRYLQKHGYSWNDDFTVLTKK